MSEIGRELEWDDEIEKESEFVLLPEGDYNFKVESLERGRSKGSDNMPPCNMAVLKIKLYSGSGTSTVTENLLLHSKLEWKLSQFFTSIGQKKKGEKLKMNWQLVPGSTGRCKVGIKQYNGKEYNEIKQFLTPEESTGYTPGQF